MAAPSPHWGLSFFHLLLLLLLSVLGRGPPPAGPTTSPVPRGRHEVHAAVHPGVGDVTLAGDEDLLLQILLILLVDVAEDGVPAGAADGLISEPHPWEPHPIPLLGSPMALVSPGRRTFSPVQPKALGYPGTLLLLPGIIREAPCCAQAGASASLLLKWGQYEHLHFAGVWH